MTLRHKVNDRYILVGQTPVPCDDLFEWAIWFGAANRQVLHTNVMDLVEISTVFLGLDHSHCLTVIGHRPMLFESMAFWPGRDGHETNRCATWEQAERMHWRMVAGVSRPAAVWEYVQRAARETWEKMKSDWGRHWRELRGVPPTELEVLMDRMEARRGL